MPFDKCYVSCLNIYTRQAATRSNQHFCIFIRISFSLYYFLAKLLLLLLEHRNCFKLACSVVGLLDSCRDFS